MPAPLSLLGSTSEGAPKLDFSVADSRWVHGWRYQGSGMQRVPDRCACAFGEFVAADRSGRLRLAVSKVDWGRVGGLEVREGGSGRGFGSEGVGPGGMWWRVRYGGGAVRRACRRSAPAADMRQKRALR